VFNKPGFNKPGFNKPVFNKPVLNKPVLNKFTQVGLLTALLSMVACHGKPLIEPTASSKPCIINFTASGSFLTGQYFQTSAPVTPGSTISASGIRAELKKRGFIASKFDTKNIIVASNPVAGVGPERAGILTIEFSRRKPIIMRVSLKQHAGQYVSSGDVQAGFCSLISAAEIINVDY